MKTVPRAANSEQRTYKQREKKRRKWEKNKRKYTQKCAHNNTLCKTLEVREWHIKLHGRPIENGFMKVFYFIIFRRFLFIFFFFIRFLPMISICVHAVLVVVVGIFSHHNQPKVWTRSQRFHYLVAESRKSLMVFGFASKP